MSAEILQTTCLQLEQASRALIEMLQTLRITYNLENAQLVNRLNPRNQTFTFSLLPYVCR